MGELDLDTAGQPRTDQGPVEGPIEDRSCRDVIFFLLYAATWVAMIVIMGIALGEGDPDRITKPMDYQGNMCGVNNLEGTRPWIKTGKAADMTDKPYLYFVNPFNLNMTKCVAECPSETKLDLFCSPPDSVDALGHIGLLDPPTSNPNCMCTYENDPPVECFSMYQSSPMFGRCVPANISMISSAMQGQLDKFNDNMMQSYADVERGYGWVLLCGLIAVVLSFVWLIVLRLLAGVMVWLSIIAAWVGLAVLTAFAYMTGEEKLNNANSFEPPDDQAVYNANAILAISYVLMVVTFVVFVVILFMFKRIQIAIGIIKEAGRALGAMPFMIFVPLICFVLLVVLFAYFAAVGFYLYSAGEITINGCCRDVAFNEDLQRAIGFHIFGSVWTAFFVIGVAQTTIAGGAAQYYFSRDKSMPMFPVWSSFWRTMRYSMGSIAFGSLIIAIVVMIRLALAYLKRQVKQYQNSACIRRIICMVECCMACFQRFLEFLTTNAYIQVAIFGTSFCTSAKNAFQLIARNAARVVAVSVVSTFVMFLGKLFIVILTLIIGVAILKAQDPPIESIILNVFLVLFAYVIAVIFFSVYEMMCKTLLQCFCEDEERNAPNFYAEPSLRQYIETYQKGPVKDANSNRQ